MENMTEKVPFELHVRIDRIVPGDGQTKAYASVTLGDAFAVHDIRITDKNNRIMVGMPFRTYKQNGEIKYTDTFHPISEASRGYLIARVTEAYEAALKQQAELEKEAGEGLNMSQQL